MKGSWGNASECFGFSVCWIGTPIPIGKRGSLSLGQKLKVSVRELMERHRPKPLPANVIEGVRAVIERARAGRA